ncbi:MAG: hypothetical protein V4787_19585 [Pseudomonadota bacterium]
MTWEIHDTGGADVAKQLAFAKADFAKFSTTDNGTVDPSDDVRDPILLVGHVMAAFSQAEADLLKTRLAIVTLGTDHVSRVNNLMQLLNKGVGAMQKKGDDDRYQLGVGSEADMKALQDRFTVEGCDKTLFSVDLLASPDPNAGQWALTIAKRSLTPVNTTLSNLTDDLSSTQSKDQTALQTLMGRYNNAIELVTASIKKNEGESEAINANLK